MGSTDHFHALDYVVLISMLSVSGFAGLWYGCRQKVLKDVKSQNLDDYLTGSKNMRPFPVSMSLVASYVSGVTILGTPTEIYNFGTQYIILPIAICLSGVVISYVYLPVLYRLQVSSSYEYLEMRFDRRIRTMVSIFFFLDEIMFLPMVMYVPSLAFNQVTGLDMYYVGVGTTILCIFYTFLGGLKAVVWTDTFQIIIMFASVIVIVIIAIVQMGGLGTIWNESVQGQRIIFNNFSPSLYERYSVYSVLIGGFSYWTSFNSVNQTMVQRYMSLPTEKKARRAILFFSIGVSLFVFVCCFSGLLIYAAYSKCDPLTSNRVVKDDQLLPLFVLEKVGHVWGLPGFFMAGLFGAGLSTLSVVLNAVSGVILEDFVKGCFGVLLSESWSHYLVKCCVLILGGISLVGMLVVQQLKGILYAATSITSIVCGTTFGIFTLGMLVPWATSKGAYFGGIAGFFMSAIVTFGNQYVSSSELVVPHKLPISVEGCMDLYNITVNAPEMIYPDESDIFPLFRLSFLWITPIGYLTVLMVGTIVSFLTGKNQLHRIDPDLISPILQWVLPTEAEKNRGTGLLKVHKRINNLPIRGGGHIKEETASFGHSTTRL